KSASSCYRFFSQHTGWTCLATTVATTFTYLHIWPMYPSYTIDGVSMEPTIPDKSIVYTRVAPVSIKQIARGDIVIAVNPTKNAELICKRVASVGGDSVTYRKLGSSIYTTSDVPKHAVWLQGDNANESLDSRSYGSLHYSMIVSKVERIIPQSQTPEPSFCTFNFD
ncbi:hypothetical protein BOX15_Mlig014258g2, partial [Macrostomum lignano]